MRKKKGKVLEGFGQFKKGEVYEFKQHNYDELLAKGRIEEVKAASRRGKSSKKESRTKER